MRSAAAAPTDATARLDAANPGPAGPPTTAAEAAALARAETDGPVRDLRWRLFLTSFLILFFELLCIRWIPAYIRNLSFFTNAVLIVSFLGIGVGILAGRASMAGARARWLPPFPWLVLALVAFVGATRFDLELISNWDMLVNVQAPPENWLPLPVILVLVTLAFVQLARPLSLLLRAMPPLTAYSIDIAGSLAGIAAFFVLSLLATSPVVWFLLLFGGYALLAPWPGGGATGAGRRLAGGWRGWPAPGALSVVIAGVMAFSFLWSPYYRVHAYPMPEAGDWGIDVNNIGHQWLVPPERKEPFYQDVYRLLPSRTFKNVLVIGAGSGSDTAVALQHHVEHVDAVEIDPVIQRLGVELHPSHPYQDPRVTRHIDDGRAYLRHTETRYDMIVFALTDSLVLTSSFSTLRLESFLFTLESFAAARDRLTPDGVLVLYNYYKEPWLVDRLAGMLETTFGTPPWVATYGGAGHAAGLLAGPGLRAADPAALAAGAWQSDQATPGPATDDWPFLYLLRPEFPLAYILFQAAVWVLAIVAIRLAGPARVFSRLDAHFFCLGAAFMLLETKSIVGFSLLFGTTWLVNSLVFFAILASVLLANLFNAWRPVRDSRPYWLALLAVLLFNYALPPERLLLDSPVLRYALASLLGFAPIFLANIVFANAFRRSPDPDISFASNLLGAMAGGMLEYFSLLTGYRSLLLLVCLLYLTAYAAGRGWPGRVRLPATR